MSAPAPPPAQPRAAAGRRLDEPADRDRAAPPRPGLRRRRRPAGGGSAEGQRSGDPRGPDGGPRRHRPAHGGSRARAAGAFSPARPARKRLCCNGSRPRRPPPTGSRQANGALRLSNDRAQADLLRAGRPEPPGRPDPAARQSCPARWPSRGRGCGSRSTTHRLPRPRRTRTHTSRLPPTRAGCRTVTCRRSSTGSGPPGAEAISINGQRLTALSAIRSAGQAILVDFRPLSPPYVISVVGDPDPMQALFANGSGGRYLRSLSDNFQIPSTITPGALPESARLQRPDPARGGPRSHPDQHGEALVIAAIGLVVGIVAGLLLHPTVPAVAAALPADRRGRRAGRGVRRRAGHPRRDLRRQGLRRVLPVQRRRRGA